jgi:hypothetical protein
MKIREYTDYKGEIWARSIAKYRSYGFFVYPCFSTKNFPSQEKDYRDPYWWILVRKNPSLYI